MVANSTNNRENEEEVYAALSNETLAEKAKQATLDNDFQKAKKLLDILEARKNNDDSMPLVKDSQKLSNDYADLMKKWEDLKPKPKDKDAYKTWLENKDKAMKVFFDEDMKKYTDWIQKNTKDLTAAKDDQIKNLQKRLDETITTMPEIGEYLSLKRRKLVSISTHFHNFHDKDNANYPKNFLIYAMWLTSTSVFGTREKLKRWRVKLMWKWKSDNIGKWLSVLEERIKINAGDKAWTKALKMQIADQLVEAKKAYVEKQKENVWLAA